MTSSALKWVIYRKAVCIPPSIDSNTSSILPGRVPFRGLDGSLMPIRSGDVDSLCDSNDSKCDGRACPQPVKVPMQAECGAERYGYANL